MYLQSELDTRDETLLLVDLTARVRYTTAYVYGAQNQGMYKTHQSEKFENRPVMKILPLTSRLQDFQQQQKEKRKVWLLQDGSLFLQRLASQFNIVLLHGNVLLLKNSVTC